MNISISLFLVVSSLVLTSSYAPIECPQAHPQIPIRNHKKPNWFPHTVDRRNPASIGSYWWQINMANKAIITVTYLPTSAGFLHPQHSFLVAQESKQIAYYYMKAYHVVSCASRTPSRVRLATLKHLVSFDPGLAWRIMVMFDQSNAFITVEGLTEFRKLFDGFTALLVHGIMEGLGHVNYWTTLLYQERVMWDEMQK